MSKQSNYQLMQKRKGLLDNRPRLVLYLYFVLVVAYFSGLYEYIVAALIFPTVSIIPIMSIGSFVAGSTFLGGGVVAFPSLTKLLHLDPNSAKVFSLAIQSIGMTSASIYVILKTPFLPYRFILINVLAGSVGVVFSLFFVQHILVAADIRLGFTAFVLCALIVYLWTFKRNKLLAQYNCLSENNGVHLSSLNKQQLLISLLAGFIGGGISGLIGSGADLVVFCLLSLYFKIDLKNSTKISIITMSSISIVATVFNIFFSDNMTKEVVELWLLAAPVVLFGAPLGTMFLRRVNPNILVALISFVAMVEVLSTLLLVEVEAWRYMVHAALAVIALLVLFFLKYSSPYR